MRGDSKFAINVAHDTKMMYGRTLDARSFMIGADPVENTKNTTKLCYKTKREAPKSL